MAKYKEFILSLEDFVGSWTDFEIKQAIGDSTNNHRVVTVSQVIRFLTTRRNAALNELGFQLDSAYELLREELADARFGTNRTDAFDINEFINVYNDVIILNGNRSIRSNFSKVLQAA